MWPDWYCVGGGGSPTYSQQCLRQQTGWVLRSIKHISYVLTQPHDYDSYQPKCNWFHSWACCCFEDKSQKYFFEFLRNYVTEHLGNRSSFHFQFSFSSLSLWTILMTSETSWWNLSRRFCFVNWNARFFLFLHSPSILYHWDRIVWAKHLPSVRLWGKIGMWNVLCSQNILQFELLACVSCYWFTRKRCSWFMIHWNLFLFCLWEHTKSCYWSCRKEQCASGRRVCYSVKRVVHFCMYSHAPRQIVTLWWSRFGETMPGLVGHMLGWLGCRGLNFVETF